MSLTRVGGARRLCWDFNMVRLRMQLKPQPGLQLSKHYERVIIYFHDKIRTCPRLRVVCAMVKPCEDRIMRCDRWCRRCDVGVGKWGGKFCGVEVHGRRPGIFCSPREKGPALAFVHVFFDRKDDDIVVHCYSSGCGPFKNKACSLSISKLILLSHTDRGWPRMNRTMVREVPLPPSPSPAPSLLR